MSQRYLCAMALILLGLFITLAFWHAEPLISDEDDEIQYSKNVKVIESDSGGARYALRVDNQSYHFNLLDPEMAPITIRALVMDGYHLVLNTNKLVPEYVANDLTCNNCHFNGGNSLGGRNNGISLVGVTTHYPSYSPRDNKTITLAGRINNCFRRSLNGKAPPDDSHEMKAILAYLHWISSPVEKFPRPLPWLGLKPIKSNHTPDPEKGKLVYERHCSACHQPDGNGAKGIPPLWGENSYNDGAGMNTMPRLSSFVLQNMPRDAPILTPEEALDVSAFLIKQPRPHFKG